MSKKLKILNVFGMRPATTGQSAGMDFFIPKFNGMEKSNTVLEAYEKSYGFTQDFMKDIIDRIMLQVSAEYGPEYAENNELNFLQLYIGLDSSILFQKDYSALDRNVELFVEDYLVFDDKKTPGICLALNDHIKFNSGIKVALDKNYCAIFFNKSGKGTKGLDVRACVIDEDYSGYVHMSMAYTKDNETDGIIYCGDKLVQLIVLPVEHTEPEEITEEDYNKIMDKSERGDSGFGSSDVKH